MCVLIKNVLKPITIMKEQAEYILSINVKREVDVDRVVGAMIEFAKEMCELQKQECANKAEIKDIGVNTISKQIMWGIDSSSILECDNVCDKK